MAKTGNEKEKKEVLDTTSESNATIETLKEGETTDKTKETETGQEAKKDPIELDTQVKDEAKHNTKEESKKDGETIKEIKEEEIPPAKPTRPLTPKQEALKNLKEAFPSLEEKLITTVLIASRYQLEPAFNSLLYYSDPDSVNIDDLIQEVAVAGQPSLPQRPSQSQLEQDEMLAKQLDEEFKRKERRRSERRNRAARNPEERNTYIEEDGDDVFTNFVEKDLPQLKEQFTKNVDEARNKFSNWVGSWKKKSDDQDEFSSFQENQQRQQQQQQPRRNQYQFDDDPEELDPHKIHGISLNDNSKTLDEELYGTKGGNPTSKAKKWEPLQDTKPEPISKEGKHDHGVVDDDFLLSDDEDVKK